MLGDPSRLGEHWIPVEGRARVAAVPGEGRHFVKPLRHAACAEGFANALLLDVGPESLPLRVVSVFVNERCATANDPMTVASRFLASGPTPGV